MEGPLRLLEDNGYVKSVGVQHQAPPATHAATARKRRSCGAGDADQGRHDALGDRLKVGVISRIAVVVPLGDDLAIDADKDGTKFVEPRNLLGMRCVNSRANVGHAG